MGTNYYLVTDVCRACGRGEPRKHIGKSSGGWCFALHVIPDEGVHDLADWERAWSEPHTEICDEYGRQVSEADMKAVITERSRPDPIDWPEDVMARNHAVLGPNNLLRHRIDRYCIGHGSGTWDLCPGEFS